MEKVINLLKNNNLSFPRILLLKHKELKLTSEELIVLIYLLNETSSIYNPKQISADLNLDVMEVLETVNSLVSKDILTIEVRKTSSMRDEHISLDNLYKKLAFLIIQDEEEIKDTSNIFDNFEKEFGRTLSPIEYELINAWKDNEISEELILLALKEAVFNGVSNLRYIDRILFEWKKKGIATKEDVEKQRVNFKGKKQEKKELFDYDWLNDDNQ
jgi:DNA replication protein